MIIGYMHSGTTLLCRVLSNHCDVFPLKGEPRFFDYLAWVKQRFPILQDNEVLYSFVRFLASGTQKGFDYVQLPKRKSFTFSDSVYIPGEQFLREIRDVDDYGLLFDFVMQDIAEKYGKKRWLDKSPTHVFLVNRIVAAIPDALFINVVRDPRDILASKKTRRDTVWNSDRYTPEQQQFKHFEKSYSPIWDTLSWRAAIQSGKQAQEQYPDKVYTVRYEDLVKDPQVEIEKICQFLALPFNDKMLNVTGRNAADPVFIKVNGINASSVGRWQSVLNKGEIVLCQTLARSPMSTYKWGLSLAPPQSYVLILRLWLIAAFEIVVRIYRRWRMGGLQFTLHILRSYFNRAKRLLMHT